MKFVVGENGRNPVKNLPRLRFVHDKTHMEGPRRELGTPAVGGERLIACATRPPFIISIILVNSISLMFKLVKFSYVIQYIISFLCFCCA